MFSSPVKALVLALMGYHTEHHSAQLTGLELSSQPGKYHLRGFTGLLHTDTLHKQFHS